MLLTSHRHLRAPNDRVGTLLGYRHERKYFAEEENVPRLDVGWSPHHS